MPVKTVHAFQDDALGDYDAVGLAEAIRTRKVSADEVIRAAVARARKVDPTIAAVSSQIYERAIAKSGTALRGPFAGVPIFIKDMLDLRGLPTGWGSNAFRKAKPALRNDRFVDQLERLGMLCLGKSTMPEFGFSASTEFPDAPPTRNPWNPERSVGGSSGGSAALVAAGVVPMAHTADGGGSTRIPSACCGLVGLKPTRGRLLASANTAHQVVAIVADGVTTRSVRDTAQYYAEAEKLYANPKLKPIGLVQAPRQAPLRIAVSTDTPGAGQVDAVTKAEFDKTVALLRSLGHEVVELEIPFDEGFARDFTVYWALQAWAVSVAGKRVINPAFEREGLSDLSEGLARFFKRNAARAPGAIRRLRKSHRAYAKAFEGFDVVLTPTVGQLTPEIGFMGMDLPYDTLFPRVEEWICYTPLANATGAPSISLPLGHDEATNLPVGMLFGAHHGEERLLLELALQLEEAQPWRRLHK